MPIKKANKMFINNQDVLETNVPSRYYQNIPMKQKRQPKRFLQQEYDPKLNTSQGGEGAKYKIEQQINFN